MFFVTQIATLSNTKKDVDFDLIWGKHFVFHHEIPEMGGMEKMFGGWYFVRQDWNDNESWCVNDLGCDLENVKYPVLVRHMHEDVHKTHTLDWKLLNNLWSALHLQDTRKYRNMIHKICKLSSYCESHHKWIFEATEHCDEGDAVMRCRLNVFLHCHINDKSVFRVFDPTHGFLPSLFG